MEAHVIVLELLPIGEVQGEGRVDVDRHEAAWPRFPPRDVQKLGEGSRRCDAIVARDDDVVESDPHRITSWDVTVLYGAPGTGSMEV